MGGVTPYTEFDRLMTALEDWYADSTRAQSYDGPGHGARKPGHAILLRNEYPGPQWRRLWYEADDDPVAQAAIINSIEEELYGLSHSPSRAGPSSGLHRGTKEWALAVASADGSLRAVARRFGVSHTEVRRQRLAHPELRAS